MRSNTSATPDCFSKLAAIEERYPAAQWTTTFRLGGSSWIRSRKWFKGIWVSFDVLFPFSVRTSESVEGRGLAQRPL
jgi:hypothetical protein